MISYLKNEEIDRNSWDVAIRQSINGNICGYSWWLDLACERWDALISEGYKQVMPLPVRKRYGITYCYQPFFTQQLGIFSAGIIHDDLIHQFLDKIPETIQYIDLKLNTSNSCTSHKFKILPHTNFLLDLVSPYEMLKASFSQNTIRNIKKGTGAGLDLVKNTRPELIIKLFRENRGKELKHIKSRDYERLKQVIRECSGRNMAESWGAFSPSGELVAGAVFVMSHQKAVFLFSGVSDAGKEACALSLILDTFVHRHSGQQLTLDFEGSDNPGLARFYRGFGSSAVRYQQVVINRLPIAFQGVYRLYRYLKMRKEF